MTLYLDTSALLKLYVVEKHSDTVKEAVADAARSVIAVVGYTEARAALARWHREGSLDDTDLSVAVEALERDWQAFTRIEVTEDLARLAGVFAEHYALRGFDAVHLAAALLLDRETQDVTFACFDDRLNQAAGQLLPLLPDSESD